MTRKPASVLRVAIVLAALLVVTLPSAGLAVPGDGDNNVPGIPVSASPISAQLDSVSDTDDVRSAWLEAGDTLTITLNRTGTFTTGFTPNLYLYAPGTTDIRLFSPVRHAEGVVMPKTITYVAPSAGLFFIDMYAPDTGTPESGEVLLTWSVLRPVFRFYNAGRNTHFFTSSAEERAMVIATWPHIFTDEGVAYYMNPFNNSTPLYRFYNRVSGSHFYTASAAERAMVNATWPHIFTDEGATYAVNPVPVLNSIPIYRFYNLQNSSHFYTASDTERDTVIANWPHIYRYEGPAFYLGQ